MSDNVLLVWGSIAGGTIVLLGIAVVLKHWALAREKRRKSAGNALYAPVIQVDIAGPLHHGMHRMAIGPACVP